MVDERADVFALGVVLYEMLTGETPVGHFESPSERSGTPAALDAVVLRAMSRKRESRQSDVGELKRELMAALDPGAFTSPSAHPSGSRGLSPVEAGASPWVDFIGFLVVGMLCSLPETVRGQSIFGWSPLSLVLIGPWLTGWLVSNNENRWKGKPLAFVTRPILGLGTMAWSLLFWLENHRDLSSEGNLVIYLLVALGLAWLVLGVVAWLPKDLTARAERRALEAASKREQRKANAGSVVAFWEASQIWDWMYGLLTLAVFLPDMHEDGYLLREAPLWLAVPIFGMTQAVGVSAALEAKNSPSASAARIFGAAATGVFCLMWAMAGGPEDLETSGLVLFGLLTVGSVASILSGINWWQSLRALGVDVLQRASEAGKPASGENDAS